MGNREKERERVRERAQAEEEECETGVSWPLLLLHVAHTYVFSRLY